MNIYIIGGGGVGSWLTPSMCMLLGSEHVSVVDGDTLEHKNLDRQLYTDSDIGKNKAAALSEKYGCRSIEKWYQGGTVSHQPTDWIIVCADNNPARICAIGMADFYGCGVIVAANETNSSEAYIYSRDWKSTRLDPRIYYPEMTSDHSGDPRARGIGCTGQAQQNNRQLVSANFMAASLAQHLFVLWAIKAQKMSGEVLCRLPYKFNANLSRLECHLVGDSPLETERTENGN